MIEENNTANNEQGEVSKSEETAETTDYKSLYHKEIQNNKKLRTRSQDAEAKLEEVGLKQENNRKERLKQEGEYKTLLTEADTEISRLKNVEKQYNGMIDKLRNDIISKFPEEEHDELSQLDYKALTILNKRITDVQAQNPPPVVGASKVNQNFDFSKMTAEEKKNNWTSIINQFKKN